MKRCDVCVTSKAVRHKPYGNLESLPISTHWWKNLSIDFYTSLPRSTNWESEIYNFILVIVNWLTKIVYYELVKVTINAHGIAEVIIDVVVRYHRLPDSIVSHWGSVFTFKFWSFLCYFPGIKRTLSTAFHHQIDSQTEMQNNTIEAYLRVFINHKQND